VDIIANPKVMPGLLIGGALPFVFSGFTMLAVGRGLHSSTVQLNLSTVYGIVDARRGSVVRVKGVYGGARVCRVFLGVRHGSS